MKSVYFANCNEDENLLLSNCYRGGEGWQPKKKTLKSYIEYEMNKSCAGAADARLCMCILCGISLPKLNVYTGTSNTYIIRVNYYLS